MRSPEHTLPQPIEPSAGWPSEAPLIEYEAAEWPRISLVMPSFNQRPYIESAIRSVLLQRYPALEMIVLDGGSSDGSAEIIRRYADSFAYWRSERDDGQASAIAAGFAMSTGDIYCWLNSDDLLLPGALRAVGRYFRTRPRVDVIYGNRLVIDSSGGVVDRHVWPRVLTSWHWALGQPLAQECCFWRRDIYERVGGIDPTKFFIMDYDLFFRMWRAGRFLKVPEILGCLRVHEETKNTRHQDVWRRELAGARVRYRLREPGWIGARVLNRTDRLQQWIEAARARPALY